ncbi:MAG: PAS domain S-box protein [Xanthobacteraceae bacterium]|nr:PAS domain S-box protein [Xanthobacteraceae bacterium]
MIAARHRAFFATRLFVGLTAVAVFPLYLAWRGAPGPLEVFALCWMLTPLLLVWYLSKSGEYERAHLLSACALAILVGLTGAVTGGLASFAAPWIVVIALEASFSASRRLIAATIAVALLTAAGLWFFVPAPASAAFNSGWLSIAGVASAALYGGGIALANSTFVREGHLAKLASEARYKLLARNMSDVIARHGRDGAITFISPAAEQLTGIPASDLLGHRLFDRVHLADRPAFLTAISDAARSSVPVSLEFRLQREWPMNEYRGAPEFVWVEMRSHGIDSDIRAGEVRQVVSVFRDITARKADALAVESARSEAERANDAKSKFLATVSHELRTPLNAIIGFSEMLAREDEMKLDAARRQDYARLIRDSGEHLLAVVNGILDMSRIEAGHFEIVTEPFAVKPLIESCRKMMSLRAEQAGIQLFTDIAADLPEINADPRALRQVVINLVSNAIKFTELGGKVDVVARACGNGIELVVSDNGVGIPEADLARLGDPFFQGRSAYDRTYEGTGLGLSVVMGLVKLHGGSVEIESRLRKGTKVLVRLPLDCQPVMKASASQITKFPQRASTAGRDEMKVRKSA